MHVEVIYAQRSLYFSNKSLLALRRVAPLPLNHPAGARNPARRRIFTRGDPPSAPVTLPAAGDKVLWISRGPREVCARTFPVCSPGEYQELDVNEYSFPDTGPLFSCFGANAQLHFNSPGWRGAAEQGACAFFFYASPLSLINSLKEARAWVLGALRVP